jgi:hypothetical protein
MRKAGDNTGSEIADRPSAADEGPAFGSSNYSGQKSISDPVISRPIAIILGILIVGAAAGNMLNVKERLRGLSTLNFYRSSRFRKSPTSPLGQPTVVMDPDLGSQAGIANQGARQKPFQVQSRQRTTNETTW